MDRGQCARSYCPSLYTVPLLHAHSCQGLHPQLAFTASAVPGFVAAETLGNKQAHY